MIGGIGARLSAFWAASKVVIVLGALLAASIWFNVHQWKQAITAPLRDEVAAKTEALKASQQLLTDTQATAARLNKAADVVATQLSGAGTAYARAAKDKPLPPQCAPGAARMEATNRALGAPETP